MCLGDIGNSTVNFSLESIGIFGIGIEGDSLPEDTETEDQTSAVIQNLPDAELPTEGDVAEAANDIRAHVDAIDTAYQQRENVENAIAVARDAQERPEEGSAPGLESYGTKLFYNTCAAAYAATSVPFSYMGKSSTPSVEGDKYESRNEKAARIKKLNSVGIESAKDWVNKIKEVIIKAWQVIKNSVINFFKRFTTYGHGAKLTAVKNIKIISKLDKSKKPKSETIENEKLGKFFTVGGKAIDSFGEINTEVNKLLSHINAAESASDMVANAFNNLDADSVVKAMSGVKSSVGPVSTNQKNVPEGCERHEAEFAFDFMGYTIVSKEVNKDKVKEFAGKLKLSIEKNLNGKAVTGTKVKVLSVNELSDLSKLSIKIVNAVQSMDSGAKEIDKATKTALSQINKGNNEDLAKIAAEWNTVVGKFTLAAHTTAKAFATQTVGNINALVTASIKQYDEKAADQEEAKKEDIKKEDAKVEEQAKEADVKVSGNVFGKK